MTKTVHGVLVVVDGVGVMITGEAAAGKSECALELVSRGHRLVADDVVVLERAGERLKGRSPERFAALLEIRDIGVFDVRRIFGEDAFAAESEIRFCIELSRHTIDPKDRIGGNPGEMEILGVRLPFFEITAEPRRNLAVLIETLVRVVRSGAKNVERTLIETHDTALGRASVQN